ncbi:MAG TPA: response regulator transcription factor [Pyrinomonadaceae bacterium]|jgi:DNA-binding response OmpR family regulator
MSHRILIVEDDKKIVATLRLYLEREGYEVYAAYDGAGALTKARVKQPSLIILDLMLPQLNGFEVCRILRDESDCHIIMLTARSAELDKLRGLDLGADDYVTKPFSPREIAARVRAAFRRQAAKATPKLPEIRVKDLAVNLESREVFVREKQVNLTPAEFNLLKTFIQAPERVFTRAELVERAFGYDYDGLERTIDAHIMNLRKKIEPDRRQPSPIKTVFGVGYKFSTQTDVL